MKSKLCRALCVMLLTSGIGATARAQMAYDKSNYDALASVNSADTISPGTQITLQNWQHYRKFMPIGIQAMFSQAYAFRVGSGPEFTVEVGPTIAVPMAKKLKEDTEKYAGQAKLRKVESGGYTVDGYMAGVPFPKPSGDLAGEEVLYNIFFGFIPPIYRYVTNSSLVDRFHNISDWVQDDNSDGMAFQIPNFSLISRPCPPTFQSAASPSWNSSAPLPFIRR